MRIFNLRFICKDQTPVEGVYEYNTYTLGDAVDVGIGPIHGIEFFVDLGGYTFHCLQCEDEHLIDIVPDNAKSPDDYINIFCHNAYEERFDVMCDYVDPERAMLLQNLWLYSVDNSPEFNYRECLAVA